MSEAEWLPGGPNDPDEPNEPVLIRSELLEIIWLAMCNATDNACEAVYEALKAAGVQLP